jgi:hypothetical protein
VPNKDEMNWKDLRKVIFQHLPEGTGKNNENPHNYKPKILPIHQQVTLTNDIQIL